MNRFFTILLIAVLAISHTIQAQNTKAMNAGDAMNIQSNGTYLGTFQPKEGDASLLPAFRTIHDKVNKSQHQEYLAAYKDSMRAIKRDQAAMPQHSSNKTLNSIDPIKTFGFTGLGNQGTPSDNTIAVGKDGKMIAAVNSSLRVYNSNGFPDQGIRSFPFFWQDVTNKTNMCDPLVHYDTDFDRYIVFTQVCDRITTDNVILVAFSATNDPAGAYHFYSFRSNLKEILGAGYPYDVWFDYPKMAVSANDLFITGNLFRNTSSTNSRYVESAIFQIDKVACFAGGTPSSLVHYNIDGNPFTITPASYGRDGNYGDKMYMCATRNSNSASYIHMYTIDGKTGSNPTLKSETINVPTYGQPADALQPGTNVELNTGDNRGMSAMLVDGTVHFVFHSSGPNGYVAINYNRLTKAGANWVAQNKLIAIPNVDCAFPSIASMGWTDVDQSALIVYNYSSLTDFPGVRCVFIDHNLNVSNYEELSPGTGYASVTVSNGTTRWGDYSGIAREHNAPTPTVWGFGMYAVTFHAWRNYIAKIETSAEPIKEPEIAKEEAIVYPVPVVDNWQIKFKLPEAGNLRVSVYDIQGKIVHVLMDNPVSEGESIFSFNKNGLAIGNYFVEILFNERVIKYEKIIVGK